MLSEPVPVPVPVPVPGIVPVLEPAPVPVPVLGPAPVTVPVPGPMMGMVVILSAPVPGGVEVMVMREKSERSQRFRYLIFASKPVRLLSIWQS